jgi:hypothetical protein
VRACKRLPTEFRVKSQTTLSRCRKVGSHLLIPQLPNIEIFSLRAARPTQEDVAGGLHFPLTNHHALTVILASCTTGRTLQHRRQRLFDLKEERIIDVRHPQRDVRMSPHRTDADDFERGIHELIAIEEDAAVSG